MKSKSKFIKNQSETVNSERNKPSKITGEVAAKDTLPLNIWSSNMFMNIYNNLLFAAGEFYSYLKEQEKTKQLYLTYKSIIERAELELENTRLKEITKRSEIYSNHQENMMKIENDKEIIEWFGRMIDSNLETINLLRNNMKNINDNIILDRIEKMHALLVELSKNLVQLKR